MRDQILWRVKRALRMRRRRPTAHFGHTLENDAARDRVPLVSMTDELFPDRLESSPS
jgi:hypothetical protein